MTVRMYRYGFFSSLAFLIPPLRWLVARQFRKFLVEEVRSAPEEARIDLVAHSFGTYLAASAPCRICPRGRKIHTVIFAGSVLRPSFPWYKYLQSGRWDESSTSAAGTTRCWCSASAPRFCMGMAGRIGFHGMVGDRFVNRYYHPCGHGGYFDREQQFMREGWLPLLTTDGPVLAHDDRPPLTALGGIKLFLLSNMQFIKVATACLFLLAMILVPLYLIRFARFSRNVESLQHIALLTNSQEIPSAIQATSASS